MRSSKKIVFEASGYNCDDARAAHTDGSANKLCAYND